MKSQYSRIEVTNLLLEEGYKPTVMKDVSDFFDVYTKLGKSRIQLNKKTKYFQRSELLVILPKEIQNRI
jgi:hypothetical protein